MGFRGTPGPSGNLSGNLPGRPWRGLDARVAGWTRPARGAALLGLGAAVALGQAPFSLAPVALAALALAFAAAPALGFRGGWLLGTGYGLLALHWIVEPFLVEPERTGFLAPVGLLAMAGGLGLFWALPFGLARRLGLGRLGLAVLWAGSEMLRSLALTGFPWALVGHVWIGTPLEQGVAWVGVHGLTLGTLLAAAALGAPGLGPAWRVAPVAVLGLLAVVLAPGPAPAPDPAAPLVRLVQPNVPQAEKWDPALAEAHTRALLDLSRGDGPAALTVWPETAPDALLGWAGPLLAEGARAGGGLLATGIARESDAGYHNSLVVADGTGAVLGVYDKAHLVPFGEYIPLRGLLSRWGLRGLAEFQGGGFEPGPGPALLEVPGIGPVRPLVCYEGIFAEEIAAGARPRLLLLVTNDAWFGRFAGPQQHLALGRLRAIEQGVPLLRAANTGISAVIDARGRVVASLGLGVAGAVEAPLPALAPVPPYARTGDAPVALALLALGALALRRRQVRGVDPGAARA